MVRRMALEWPLKRLTGRTRFRRTIFGKYVLQVEEITMFEQPDPRKAQTALRDATDADMQEIVKWVDHV